MSGSFQYFFSKTISNKKYEMFYSIGVGLGELIDRIGNRLFLLEIHDFWPHLEEAFKVMLLL